jgi:cytoskeletal protein CcmA (bactofilin family)
MALFGSTPSTNNTITEPITPIIAVAPQPVSLTCIIAKGTVIEGKITSTENIRVDGKIKGKVLCDKNFEMEADGIVEGDVQAGESTIRGQVIGTVSVMETLHLLKSSFIKGDIKAKKLHVEEGAKYDGKCLIG